MNPWKGGAVCLAVAAGVSCFAEENIAPIGRHYPLFVLEKNENPQNILITYVKLGDRCQILEMPDSHGGYIDSYWLLDRKKFKPVHPLIRQGIRNRLKVSSLSGDNRKMVLTMTNLKEFNPPVRSVTITVQSSTTEHGCALDSILDVDGSRMKLEKVYSEATKTFLPPFRKLKALTVTGQSLAGVAKIERRYPTR